MNSCILSILQRSSVFSQAERLYPSSGFDALKLYQLIWQFHGFRCFVPFIVDNAGPLSTHCRVLVNFLQVYVMAFLQARAMVILFRVSTSSPGSGDKDN